MKNIFIALIALFSINSLVAQNAVCWGCGGSTTTPTCDFQEINEVENLDLPQQENFGDNIQTGATAQQWGNWNIPTGQFNVIQVDGTTYGLGADNAHSGNQFMDIANANAMPEYCFNVPEGCEVTVTATVQFNNRWPEFPAYVAWDGTIDVKDSAGNLVAAGNTVVFDTSVSQELWLPSTVNTTLTEGDYCIVIGVGDWGHFDSIDVNIQ